MLSRVANSLYWMSRYVERSENIARIVDVNLQLLLDFRNLDHQALAGHWVPIVQSTGDEQAFFALHPKATGQAVTQFLVFQTENPNSIVSSMGSARENARMVRDQITSELWEELNRLFLFLKSKAGRDLWKMSPSEFLQEVKACSLHLQGLADATVVHNEGWQFMQVGKFLERADKTTRMLDVRHKSAQPAQLDGEIPIVSQSDALEWSAVLRSCSAWDAYKSLHGAEVSPRLVAEFLLFSEDFPRSVHFSVRALDTALRAISGASPGRFTNVAEKLCGRLLPEFQFSTIEEIFETGFHKYLDLVQQKLNAIGEAVFTAYIFQRFDAFDQAIQQQQQQQ
jgi:uncharacterized alpha-E superfamily protein